MSKQQSPFERDVDEGDPVKAGQVVARLDRDQLLAQRQHQVAALASAESQLAEARTALEWEKATLAADVEQKKADLASSESRLLELKTITDTRSPGRSWSKPQSSAASPCP